MAESWLTGPCSTAIGSLPHRDTTLAVRLALSATSLPAIPTLPRRSPAEGMIQQALVGIPGVGIGQYGSITIEPQALDPLVPVSTPYEHDAFEGFRAFLAAAPPQLPAVKWQLVGPVTLGLSLLRAGAPASVAFDVAVRAVREHAQFLLDRVAEALPNARQVVFIDEPSIVDIGDAEFPVAPDTAIDLMSGALAAIEPRALAGVHCCAPVDVSLLTAAGPGVLSLPVRASLVEEAPALGRYLATGGVVAWGAVPTGGPIPHSAERPWRQLAELWCGLVAHGIDPGVLRTQAIITPECGLGLHSPTVADRVFAITADIARKVHDQATASRWVLGA